MEIKQARFVISVADKEKILTEEIPEIAVAGKSNVGKSSFINFMTNNGKFMLVDLPGYGFAKVTDAEKAKWAKLMEGYILESRNLANVFILVDVRHEPTALDKQMVNFLQYYTIPFTVIATKCDKLSRAQISRRKREIAAAFAMGEGNIITVSSLTKVGKEAVLDRIEQVITHFLPRSGEEDTDA